VSNKEGNKGNNETRKQVQHYWGVKKHFAANKPFPSFKYSPFQNDAKSKTFLVKINLICTKIIIKKFPYEWLRTYPHFGTEAWGNSEMASPQQHIIYYKR